MSKNLGMVIVGMHRSGTSLLTEMLHHDGWHVGSRLLPANDFNPRGYWEHRDVVDLHDEFFRALGRTWADPRPLPSGCFESSAAERARVHLRAVLEEDFLSADRWVVKDPRICLLLPLWLPVVEELDRRIHFLHVVRHPQSSAQSLERRENMPIALGLQLWLRHNLAAERATRETERSWICFEDLLDGGQNYLRRRLAENRLPRPEVGASTQSDEAVVQPDLVHHHTPSTSAGESQGMHPWIATASHALASLCQTDREPELSPLDGVRVLVERADQLLIGNPESWPAQVRDERLHYLFAELRELRCSSQRLEEGRLQADHHLGDEMAHLQRELTKCTENEASREHTQRKFMSALHQLLETGVHELRTTAQLERQKIRQLELRVRNAERQLAYVENSVSWRLTAPARALVRALRSLLR